MTGKPDLNFELFNTAAKAWREAGWFVFNPAETDNGSKDKPREWYLRMDLVSLADSDAIALLPGWKRSKGALLELYIAKELGLEIYDALAMQPFHETILQEAQRLVYGDRRSDYGHPADDYGRVAKIWSIILKREVSAEQAALCMIGVKLSRLCNEIKRDSLVDVAGYAEVVNCIVEAKANGESQKALTNS